ncbi:aggregation promoting factor-like surface protein [Levilactobacillus acidifarinae DSM 19394]|uniref:Aggregation promoting factor-like surface protein n=2 Tax=Levilactobacillus acidifarinae TaxID=267364 RepID=A0A0R1LEB5_9LACO|nr:aggregation promoting factor-like surface protein [Levilactobacillus acidifarinae DSM 19394]GEO70594.1 aggregation promoting protein [Levilactobacillus acidifarinae]
MVMLTVLALALPSVAGVADNTITAQAKTKVTYVSNLSQKQQAAKDWIAMRESGGNYRARNGIYYGKYQLTISMLHGDYSKANQEKTADRYTHNRYGTWTKAKRHWVSHHWY